MNLHSRIRHASGLICAAIFGLALTVSTPAHAVVPSVDNPDPIPAGRVNLIAGQLQIITPGQAARVARRGDPVMEGDTLITGSESEGHLTMSDSGYLVLRAFTRIQIANFKADGSEEDQGAIRLFVGSLRSITGWIGKFNRSSYKLQTPTATIGIRGTDHETRYIPPDSSEGEPGTYDKVFIGETSLLSDNGLTSVTAEHAGYAASEGDQGPLVLSHVPGFFKPGPHEDLINRKHAEIQKLIEQRREERRRIVEQKRAQFLEAKQDVKNQAASNKLSAEARAKALAEQNENTAQQLAALHSHLKTEFSAMLEMRRSFQQQLLPLFDSHPKLHNRFKSVWKAGRTIAEEYQAIRDERQAINAKNTAAIEARNAAANEQHKNTEMRLAELTTKAEQLNQRKQTLAASREALERQASSLPPKELALQRQQLNAIADELAEEQRRNTADFDALFDSNIGATLARLEDADTQQRQYQEQNAALNDRADAVHERQLINDNKLLVLQERAVGLLGSNEDLRVLFEKIREAMDAIHVDRDAIRAEKRAIHAHNRAANMQRHEEALQQINALQNKHREMVSKRGDLQGEQKSMHEEMQSLIEQERTRYWEELREDRALGSEE